jgi:hypothetical protein
VTDVGSADELARIAEHYDRVVLHAADHAGDVYVVDDGVTVYRLVVPAGAAPTGAALPASWR